jgi:hypothetical protein
MNESQPFRVGEYTISGELFETGMMDGTGPCRCTSTCCLAGVYADVRERDRVMANKEIIARYMDETQPTDPQLWFEDDEAEDEDFPSGRCVGTREVNDKCAFLDKMGRCSLQVAAVGEGLHRWTFKPLYCILYPVEISGKVVRFDDLLQGDEQCCSVSDRFQIPLFEACRDELTHLLGEEGYRSILSHYREMQHTTDADKENGIDE